VFAIFVPATNLKHSQHKMMERKKKLVGYASARHWLVQRPPRQSPEKTEKDDPALAEKQDPRIIDRELTDKADWGTPPPRRSARWLA